MKQTFIKIVIEIREPTPLLDELQRKAFEPIVKEMEKKMLEEILDK